MEITFEKLSEDQKKYFTKAYLNAFRQWKASKLDLLIAFKNLLLSKILLFFYRAPTNTMDEKTINHINKLTEYLEKHKEQTQDNLEKKCCDIIIQLNNIQIEIFRKLSTLRKYNVEIKQHYKELKKNLSFDLCKDLYLIKNREMKIRGEIKDLIKEKINVQHAGKYELEKVREKTDVDSEILLLGILSDIFSKLTNMPGTTSALTYVTAKKMLKKLRKDFLYTKKLEQTVEKMEKFEQKYNKNIESIIINIKSILQ